MKKDDFVYVGHLLDAIAKIEKYLEGVDEKSFLKNSLVQDAAVRQFEIIGEAAKNISPEFRKKNPQVPWSDMARTRDKLIHDYVGVDAEAIWATAEKNLPPLKKQLLELLPHTE